MARTIKTPRLEFSVSTEYTPCDDILKSVKKGDARLDFRFKIPENEEYPAGYSVPMNYSKEDLIDSPPFHAEKISDDEVKIVVEPQTIKFSIKKQFKDYFLSPDTRFELRGLSIDDDGGRKGVSIISSSLEQEKYTRTYKDWGGTGELIEEEATRHFIPLEISGY